jgi:hypothetical protein
LFNPDDHGPYKFKVETVITALLPPLGIKPSDEVTIRAVELARRWCISCDTVADLLRASELREFGKHNSAIAADHRTSIEQPVKGPFLSFARPLQRASAHNAFLS